MKKIKGYITPEELTGALLLLDNAQDRFILVAIYNGIAGKNSMSELLQLKTKSVDFNRKTITLTNRVIKMDSILEKATKDAIKQTISFIEIRKGVGKCCEEIELNMESPYVLKIRPRYTNMWGLDAMSYGGFRTRFSVIKEKCGINVNASELETSGIINSLLAEKKEWTVLDIEYTLRSSNIQTNAYRIYTLIKEINA